MSKKISQLPAITAPNVAAQIPLAYAGVTYAATIAVLTGIYYPTAVLDQRAAVQAAIDSVVSTRAALTIAAGTAYLSSGGLTVATGFKLTLEQGAIIDFAQCANDTCCISGTGTEAAALALTVNAAKGATSVTMSPADAATLAQGDQLRIASNTVFDASSTNSKIGEMVRVESVAAGVVTLSQPLRGGPYNTASAAAVSKITPIKGVQINGGTIRGGGTLTTAGVDKDHRGIQLFLADDCVVQNVRFERTDLVGIWWQDAIFCRVLGGHAKDFVNDQQAYGVLFDNACQDCCVDGFTAERVRHIVTTGNSTAPGNTKGIVRRISFVNMKCWSTTPARGGGGGDAFDTHTAAEDLSFTDCVSYSSTGAGFNIECPGVTLLRCESYYSTDAGFILHNESDQEAQFAMTRCRAVSSGAEGFRVTHPTRGSIARVRYLRMDDCAAEDTAGIGIFIANTVTTLTLRNINLAKCTVVGCKNANASVWVQNAETADLDLNVSEPTQVAANLVRIRDSLNVKVGGSLRHVDNSNGAICVYINATGAGLCQKVLVDGLRASGTTPTNLRGVFADTNAQNCTIGVVDLQECNTPLDLQAGTGHRIYQRPGVSSDNGDTSPTLTVNSAPTQRFNAPLTAPRTVTAPTGSLASGLKFRVVREAGATGAFNLTVFGGKVLAAAGNWVDYECDGAGYRETGSGAL